MLKRRKTMETNYRKRLALLKSKKPRLVVRKSLSNIHAQLIEYDQSGDRVVAENVSKNLKKYGWKSHCGNIPASYLTGFLIGFEALKRGINEAVLDIGLQTSTKQNSLYALVKGANDAGLRVPLGSEIAPDHNRISGKHIAEFAAKLKVEDPEMYKRQFSECLKAGLNPEDLPKHFEEVKNKIKKEFEK